VEGLPQGILRAALITLHRDGERVSKVGSSVKVVTEHKSGVDPKKGSNGSGGGGGWVGGVREVQEMTERGVGGG
jgi:hypothetical protein